MIAVSDIILKMRSRLGDNDPLKYKWSDAELIDSINSALIQLSTHMLTSTRVRRYATTATNNRYELPHNMVKVIAITIENEPVIIKSFEWIQNNKNILSHNVFYVCMDEQSFYLYPIELLKDAPEVEFSYNYIQHINDASENIDMTPLLSDAILFYAMHLSLQVNTSEKNAGKSMQYLNLFKDQVATLSGAIYKNKHSKKLTTRYKRI